MTTIAAILLIAVGLFAFLAKKIGAKDAAGFAAIFILGTGVITMLGYAGG